MNHALLRIPGSHPTVWETDMVARIRQRVAASGAGDRHSCALILLLIQTKIDGSQAKLALLAGVESSQWRPALRATLDLLAGDPKFHRLFHHLRSRLN